MPDPRLDSPPGSTVRWRRCRALIAADAQRWIGHRPSFRELLALAVDARTFLPVATMRLRQHPPLPQPLVPLLGRLHVWAQRRAGMDLPYEAAIGPGFTITHGWGLVVSPLARLGSNVTLFHGVTIGRKDSIDPAGERTVGGAPSIGDGVWIGPNAIVLGAIRIGSGSVIGGGAVVTKDVPPASLVVGNPARVIAEGVARDAPNAVGDALIAEIGSLMAGHGQIRRVPAEGS